jgi:hypothetical protein
LSPKYTMRGTERTDGGLRYFYQYKPNGPKFYYKKKDTKGLRIPFRKPFVPNCTKPRNDEGRHEYVEYVPPVRLPPMEAELLKLHPDIQKLITTWLLVFGFANINLVTEDKVKTEFRKQSLIHHPDRGGREEIFKELSSVRDHLLTLCVMCAAIRH